MSSDDLPTLEASGIEQIQALLRIAELLIAASGTARASDCRP